MASSAAVVPCLSLERTETVLTSDPLQVWNESFHEQVSRGMIHESLAIIKDILKRQEMQNYGIRCYNCALCAVRGRKILCCIFFLMIFENKNPIA